MKSSSLIFASALFLSAGGVLAQGGKSTAAPTDAQIAHIVVTANQIDIDAGKLAQTKAVAKDVQAFAMQMVSDHGAVNLQANALATKLKMTPEDNSTSKNLMSGAEDNLKKLKGLSGKDFDKAYVDNEVTFHQTVLDAIDKTLLPNARNDELKGLIAKTKPVIAGHLDHAKRLQSSLK